MTLRAVVVLFVVAVALSACGGGTTVSETSSPTMSRASQTAQPKSETTGAAVEPTDEAEVLDLIGFTSPGGAISCMLDADFARCDVTEHTWQLPPRPADCEGDFGHGVSMAAGERAELVCAGDTTAGAGDPLAYGQSVGVEPFTCDSAESGVTCRDANTGSGFRVAREAYEIF